jgi:hypothetical protein
MQLYSDIEQGTPEWYDIRLGKLTGSSAAKLFGTAAAKEKYLYDRAAEIVTGCRCDGDESARGIHMARGHEFEEVAIAKYTVATLTQVQRVGFVQLNEFVGCSPDGLVGDDGMIEVKVPDSNNYFRQILELASDGVKAIPNDYYAQMQFNMFVCGRSWCDYVLYNPKHEANNKSLFIQRVEKDNSMQERISSIIDECVAKIKGYTQSYYESRFKNDRIGY